MTTATIATAPENTTPTTFRSISGFALPSVSQKPTLPIGFLFLKLPPPPCAVLLVELTNNMMFGSVWWLTYTVPQTIKLTIKVRGPLFSDTIFYTITGDMKIEELWAWIPWLSQATRANFGLASSLWSFNFHYSDRNLKYCFTWHAIWSFQLVCT